MNLKKVIKNFLIMVPVMILISAPAIAQRVAFINSETIREHFIEAQQAEQRIQSMVEEWKREMAGLQKEIEALEFEIEKNRLIWSDDEKREKKDMLERKQVELKTFAKKRFEPGGEYDNIVKEIMRPVEEKIYAAVQKVAADERYDIILDQSIQPLPYVNFKYDMTVDVLRNLGVDVEELEKELQEKIKKDPRNKQPKSYEPRRRSRSRRINPNEREVQREETQQPEAEEQEENPNMDPRRRDKQPDQVPEIK